MMAAMRSWLPLTLHALFIFWASSLSHPAEYFPAIIFGVNDKVLHAFLYAVFGILLYRAILCAGISIINPLLLAMLGSGMYAASDEWHQLFVPLRNADGWDVLADILGASVGIYSWRELIATKPMVDSLTPGEVR